MTRPAPGDAGDTAGERGIIALVDQLLDRQREVETDQLAEIRLHPTDLARVRRAHLLRIGREGPPSLWGTRVVESPGLPAGWCETVDVRGYVRRVPLGGAV